MAVHFYLTDIQTALIFNGVMVAGLVISMWLQVREGRKRGYPVAAWLTVIAVMNGLMVLGSRLGGLGPGDWSGLFSGGPLPPHAHKTVMGGLLLALPCYFLLKKWWRLPSGTLDVIVLAFPLMAAIGRIGCLFAGCCFGEITGGGWGICYAPGTPAYAWQSGQGLLPPGAPASLPVHPVQLYFLLTNVLVFFVLYKYRNRFRKAGSLALAGLGLLMAFRFFHEFFREAGSDAGIFGQFLLGIKTVQWICLGISLPCLTAVLARERKAAAPAAPEAAFPEATLFHESAILFLTALFGWSVRHFLSSVEVLVLTISFIPALAGLLKRLLRLGWLRGSVLLPYAMVMLTLAAFAGISADTLVPAHAADTGRIPGKPYRHWIDAGVGGTTGNWSLVTRDCGGNVIGTDKISDNSFAAEANYHLAFKNAEFVLGERFIHGKAFFSQDPAREKLTYTLLGTTLCAETKWVGVIMGYPYPIELRRSLPAYNTAFEIGHYQDFPILGLRVGKRDKYFVDAGWLYNNQFSYFPEPVFSAGLVNWGFNDPSGRTNVRAGIVSMQDELGWLISGKVPVEKTGFDINAGLYFQRGVLFSGGLRYTFPEFKSWNKRKNQNASGGW